MTFRDDHDAALARANALEDEVERTKEERDALAAKVKALEAQAQAGREAKEQLDRSERRRLAKSAKEKAAKQRVSSDDAETRSDKRAGIAIAIGTTVLFGGMMAFGMSRSCKHDREVAAWRAKSEARQHHISRWNALVSVEHCVRRIAFDSVMARRHTPDKIDPRTTVVWHFTDGVVGNCLHGATALVGDAKTPQPVKTAIGQFLDVQKALETPIKQLAAYYQNNDWKEDNFTGAPALWKPVIALLDRQVKAIEVIRRDAFPAIRAEIRGYLAAHEKAAGRDEIYWRGALTVQLWEINDRAYASAGTYAGREADDAAAVAAIQQQVIAFLDLAKEAPIEVRREVRKLDWVTSQIVAGGPLRGETPLWHLANADEEWIGRGKEHVAAMPPDPGERPVDPD